MEMIAWHVPTPLKGSQHSIKYRFAFIENGACVLRNDNEAGKGDHKHLRNAEQPLQFSSLDILVRDFIGEVEEYSRENADRSN